jgi:hypothetical protein
MVQPLMMQRAEGDKQAEKRVREEYGPWKNGKRHRSGPQEEQSNSEDEGSSEYSADDSDQQYKRCPVLEKLDKRPGGRCACPGCDKRPMTYCVGCNRVVCATGPCNVIIHNRQ